MSGKRGCDWVFMLWPLMLLLKLNKLYRTLLQNVLLNSSLQWICRISWIQCFCASSAISSNPCNPSCTHRPGLFERNEKGFVSIGISKIVSVTTASDIVEFQESSAFQGPLQWHNYAVSFEGYLEEEWQTLLCFVSFPSAEIRGNSLVTP